MKFGHNRNELVAVTSTRSLESAMKQLNQMRTAIEEAFRVHVGLATSGELEASRWTLDGPARATRQPGGANDAD